MRRKASLKESKGRTIITPAALVFFECLTLEEYHCNIYVVSILKASGAHPGGKLSNPHHQ